MDPKILIHVLACVLLSLSVTLMQSCNPVSPYKIELENNQFVCLKNNELFNATFVLAKVSTFEDYRKIEIEAYNEVEHLFFTFIIEIDQQVVGSYFYENKVFNNVPYALNKVELTNDETKIKNSTLYCSKLPGQIEITKFDIETQTISGFINAKLCNETNVSESASINITEGRFYNVDFQVIKE